METLIVVHRKNVELPLTNYWLFHEAETVAGAVDVAGSTEVFDAVRDGRAPLVCPVCGYAVEHDLAVGMLGRLPPVTEAVV